MANWYTISKKKKNKLPKGKVIGPYIIDPEGMPPGEYYDAGGYLQLANRDKEEIVKESSETKTAITIDDGEEEFQPSLADEKAFDESLDGDSQTASAYTVSTPDKLKLEKNLKPAELDKELYEFLIEKGIEELIESENVFDPKDEVATTCQQYNASSLIDFLNPFLAVFKGIDTESIRSTEQLKNILKIAYYAEKTKQPVAFCLTARM